MSRRSNFIEGNDNFREQNLRFVRNEYEDNINQFFGGANPGSSKQQQPPPRDSLIVQPTPGKAGNELDTRRQFIRELGANRMKSQALALRTLQVPDFNLRNYQRQRYRLSVELGDSRQDEVDAQVLRSIGEAVDRDSQPRTPSPPRNIDWHNHKSNNSNDRSRPSNSREEDQFRGRTKVNPNRRENNRGFVEPERDEIDQHEQPFNSPNKRNREFKQNTQKTNSDQFNRSNLNASPQKFNRNNSYVHSEAPNRNANPQAFHWDNRNANNRNANQQEFKRNNRNMDSGPMNRNNRNFNPEVINRNANPPQFNRNNRGPNPEANNRNANPQEFNRNNRNSNNMPINRTNRNVNQQEIIPNTNVNRNEINRNPNIQKHNRNINNLQDNNYRNANQQEFNRNNRNLNNDNINRNFRKPNDDEFNRNANRRPNASLPGQQFNPRDNPSTLNNSRFNKNIRAPRFIPIQQPDEDVEPIMDEQVPDDNFQRLPRGKPQHQQLRFMGQANSVLHDPEPNPVKPRVSRNYQRIVHDNQITICRTDLLEPTEPEVDDEVYDQDTQFTDDRDFDPMDEDSYQDQPDDRFFGSNQDDQEFHHTDRFERNFEDNQTSIRDQRFDDRKPFERRRNNRNFVGDNYGNQRQFNDNRDFDRSHNPSRGVGNQRFQPRESGTFQGSNNPDFSRNQYQKQSNRNDNLQSGGPNPVGIGPKNFNSGGANPNRKNLNPTRSNQDRNLASNINIVEPAQPKSNDDRNPRSVSLSSRDRKPRSISLASQDRNSARNVRPNRIQSNVPSSQDGNATRKVISGGPGGSNPIRVDKPGGANKNNPQGPNPNKATNPPANRARNPNQVGPPGTASNQDKKNPRAGQKRGMETAGLGASNRSSKAEIKRQRVIDNRGFVIGGYRLPYINQHLRKLPQPEDQSYAVTFFEQKPIYNTHAYATEDGRIELNGDDESDTESLDSNPSESNAQANYGNKKVRTRLRKEWTKIYREKNYRDWNAWWQDYKWCGSEIDKKLEKFDNLNLRHRFGHNPKKTSTEDMIDHVFQQAHNGLAKNNYNSYGNMRSIFLLMNETFLENLSVEQMEQLQDLIRGIPNHLWLYKIRSMVYLWETYHRCLKNRTSTFVKKAGELKTISRTWNNPLFQWLAKQAFDELKAISAIAWPDHNTIFAGFEV